MAILDGTLRRRLERIVSQVRGTAEQAAARALNRYRLTSGEAPPLAQEERELRRELRAQLSQLPGFRSLVEQCAYEHWHRILFARFLAENELLIHPEAGVAVSLEECDNEALQRSAGASDAYDLAGRYASRMLPAVFRPDDALLRVRLAPEDRLALEAVVQGLPVEVFRADDSLGWTYQFWQKDRKDAVNDAEAPIEGSDICAVTQLFTEHYMVRFLLENTLGAWWLRRYPESPLRQNWAYYKPEIPHRLDSFPERLEEVTLLDPCCGSGHFLVEAFLMLLEMYRELGFDAAEAGDAALSHNLFGLELDPRCTQIAAFNLAFAAWRTGGYRTLPELRIACSGLPLRGTQAEWERLAGSNEVLRVGMRLLYEHFSQAEDLGSLIDPPDAFRFRDGAQRPQLALDGMQETARQRELDLAARARWEDLLPLLTQALEREERDEERGAYFAGVRAQGVARAAELLSRRYWYVVTNPPFLKVSKAGLVLRSFCEKRYPDAKKDLATCFVERCRRLTEPEGEYALVNPQNWLFLKTDRDLRRRLLTEQRWLAVIRLGEHAFESQTAAGAFVSNLIFANRAPFSSDEFFGLDASAPRKAQEKAALLREARVGAQETP
jgi:Eco57I restriction-modification methylase